MGGTRQTPSQQVHNKLLVDQTSFAISEKNEAETAAICLAEERNCNYLHGQSPDYWRLPDERIYYISDIHLDFLLRNKRAKSPKRIEKVIKDLAKTIVEESHIESIILINGDTSPYYEWFKMLAAELTREYRTVVFTLGNHETWSCPDKTIDEIADTYRAELGNKKIWFLHNNVLFFEEFNESPKEITEEELKSKTSEELRTIVKSARLILFGGTGFSGYNTSFNAESGIYRYNKTIGYSREIEIRETKRFEALYKKVSAAFVGKSVAVVSHMPFSDWYEAASRRPGEFSNYQKGFIYVSGHSHRNFFYDDGDIRIYADNQFGYNNSNRSAWPHLKYFEVEKAIDVFADYSDGIYGITKDDYIRFIKGKNIHMDFNRQINELFMLKRNGFYCFLHRSEKNRLSILNGGMMRNLDHDDLEYYYDRMDFVISVIKNPLDKYTAVQKSVSEAVKKLGGYGTIHGCIVDIDWYNHIYINPNDGTMTGYWAHDMINKQVYQAVPALLHAKCPEMYASFVKLIESSPDRVEVVAKNYDEKMLATKPIAYLETDIYKASRQIIKMQKLYSNILTTWPKELPERKMLRE